MRCSFCSQPLTSEMRFCPFCGTKILTTRNISPETPTERSQPPTVEVIEHRPPPAAPRPKPWLWRLWLVLGLTFILLMLVLIGVFAAGV
jgi:predicted amidophosphoribosyltransferase